MWHLHVDIKDYPAVYSNRIHQHVQSAVSLNLRYERSSYALGKLISSHIYKAHMSPFSGVVRALNVVMQPKHTME